MENRVFSVEPSLVPRIRKWAQHARQLSTNMSELALQISLWPDAFPFPSESAFHWGQSLIALHRNLDFAAQFLVDEWGAPDNSGKPAAGNPDGKRARAPQPNSKPKKGEVPEQSATPSQPMPVKPQSPLKITNGPESSQGPRGGPQDVSTGEPPRPSTPVELEDTSICSLSP